MKWMLFVFSLLACTLFYRSALGKAPKTIQLSEAKVATVQTAMGYTTMLQFDGRPTSAVLGDQDAFKVEYIGNGLAIKPVVPGARTNLFVFTDYDRFNFRLVTGAAAEADYLIKVKREGYSSGVSLEGAPGAEPAEAKLIRRNVRRRASCGGLSLFVDAVAWPESQSTYLVQFRAEAAKSVLHVEELRFEPGDFEVLQDGRNLPIESLHLNRLTLTRAAREVAGTLVLRRASLSAQSPIRIRFLPDFHRIKFPTCPAVSFLRNGSAPATGKVP